MQRLLLAGAMVALLSGCQLTGSGGLTGLMPDRDQHQEEYSLNEGLDRYALLYPASTQQPDPDSRLTPQQQADLWDRIRMQMTVQVPEHKRIDDFRDWYIRHPHYIDRVAQRAAPFLHLIVEEIEARDLPVELVLVPVVESAYDTFAYSHGRASGIWQFIPSTARHYGLKMNWWYDGRRDVLAATKTALDYFERLGRTFDEDWLLALAAYNAGQGRVANAVRRNAAAGKPTDFWHLSLPQETRNYVPKILALADLLKNSNEYQVAWRHVPNQPVLEVIDPGHQVDLAMAAEQAGISLAELHRYNAGYNRWATSPEGPHQLIVPAEHANQLRTALANSQPEDWVAWHRHEVQPGESLSVIAQQYGTTSATIRDANDLAGSIIRTGDHLLIPTASQQRDNYTLSAEQRLASTQNRDRQGERTEHRVQSGDTLWDLSRMYGVSIRDLASWNNMAPGDPLRPGQTLAVWLSAESSSQTVSTPSSQPVTRTIQYQVRQGDSLARIASRFQVRISDIERWNEISREGFLQPGQRLTLHVDVANGSI